MEEKDQRELEDKIQKALEGETNEWSRPLQNLGSVLKEYYFVPPASRFPDFDELWNKSQKHPLSHPLNQESGDLSVPDSAAFDSGRKSSQAFHPKYKNLKLAASLAAAFLLALGLGFFGYYNFSVPGAAGVDSPPMVSRTLFQAEVRNLHRNSYLLEQEEKIPLVLGSRLRTGDRIEVEESGFLDLSVSEEAFLRLGGGTSLSFQNLEESGSGKKIRIALEKGRIVSYVRPSSGKTEMAISTDLGDVVVRGTRFVTEWRENRLRIGVLEGKVVFRKASEQTGQPGLGESESFREDPDEISILPQSELTVQEKSYRMDSLSREFFRSLAELDYWGGKNEISDELRTIRTVDDLFRVYSILERIELEGGETITGVVYDMDGTTLYVRTVEGERKIPESKILNIEKIR